MFPAQLGKNLTFHFRSSPSVGFKYYSANVQNSLEDYLGSMSRFYRWSLSDRVRGHSANCQCFMDTVSRMSCYPLVKVCEMLSGVI